MAKRKKKKWMSKAVKRPGALNKKARQAGKKSWQAYCRSLKNGKWHKGVSTRTKRQCNLAKTFKKYRKGKKK